MGQLWKILLRAGVVLGSCISIGTLLLDLRSALTLGLPGNVWMAFGLALFFVSIIAIVYGQQKEFDELKVQIEKQGQVSPVVVSEQITVEQNKERLKRIRDVLTTYIKQGENIFKEGKDQMTENRLADWTQQMLQWTRNIVTYLRNDLEESAVVIFSDTTSMLPITFNRDFGDKHNGNLQWMDRALGNLRKILVGLQS